MSEQKLELARFVRSYRAWLRDPGSLAGKKGRPRFGGILGPLHEVYAGMGSAFTCRQESRQQQKKKKKKKKKKKRGGGA
jgi:hypothetical protein